MVFRKNWARTTVMLMLVSFFGYEMNLDGSLVNVKNTLNHIVSVCTEKPIKIPAKEGRDSDCHFIPAKHPRPSSRRFPYSIGHLLRAYKVSNWPYRSGPERILPPFGDRTDPHPVSGSELGQAM